MPSSSFLLWSHIGRQLRAAQHALGGISNQQERKLPDPSKHEPLSRAPFQALFGTPRPAQSQEQMFCLCVKNQGNLSFASSCYPPPPQKKITPPCPPPHLFAHAGSSFADAGFHRERFAIGSFCLAPRGEKSNLSEEHLHREALLLMGSALGVPGRAG